MLFYEKLDFLMKLTNTTNSSLSMHTSLDPSFISRLRRGRRNPVKNETYIKNMAKYFSRHCTESYQSKTLLETLKVSDICTESEIADQICQWLKDAQQSDYENVGRFLDRMTSKTAPCIAPMDVGEVTLPERETTIYYGIEGKRIAVTNFLHEALKLNPPITLLLFSDEPTDWMTSNPDFAAKWASLMFTVLTKGNRIRIIHTVSRDLDEMLNAIGQWMPLYMTGLIEPYYYPKKRDGLFKRTLFIAPQTTAVVSTSVGNMVRESANFLVRGTKAVNAFEKEFHNYCKLCNPLMRIYTSANQQNYMETIYEFEKERADAIIKTESLSLLTMPENVLSSIMERIHGLGVDPSAYFQNRKRLFIKNIDVSSFTEIIRLPDPQDVKNGKVVVAFSDILYGGTVYYSASEYILHLENIVALLKEYLNFHVCLITKETDTRYMVYSKEDLGVIVAKTSTPSVVLAINEENMTAAFWDFLKNLAGEKAYDNPNNQKIAKALSDYIRLLKA